MDLRDNQIVAKILAFLGLVLDKIKAGYFFLEDKYYWLLDKISERVPVYKLVDPIDRVFPSFLLLIIIILVVLLLLGVFVFNIFGSVSIVTKIQVLDDETMEPVEGASIRLLDDSGNQIFFGRSDENGMASLPLKGSASLFATVKKEGYRDVNDTFDFSVGDTRQVFLVAAPAGAGVGGGGFAEKRILIVDEKESTIKQEVTVSFSCSNIGAEAPATASTRNGEITVNVSEGCGIATAKASATGYNTGQQQLTQELTTIRLSLQGKVTTGDIHIIVEDENKNALSGVELTLFDDLSAQKDLKESDASGTVDFTGIKVGKYKAQAYIREDGRFGDSGTIFVEAGKTVTKTITLRSVEKSAMGKIFLKIIDSKTKEPVNGVEATVFRDQNSTAMIKVVTNTSGLVPATGSLVADKNSQYSLVLYNAGYVTKILPSLALKEVIDLTPEIIEMEKIDANAGNYGKAKVKLTDYTDKKPVKDAQVLLYNREFPWMIIRYPYVLSNADGVAEFSPLPAGTYFAAATKGDTRGESIDGNLALGKTLELSIVLVLRSGNFEVTLLSIVDGNAVRDATVGFFDAETNQKVDENKTGLDGKLLSKQIKVDRQSYFTARAENYFTYVSRIRDIMPSPPPNKVTAIMTPVDAVDLNKPIAMRFLGFYTDKETTKKETILKAGSGNDVKNYYLKFYIYLTREASYSEILDHFRFGRKEEAGIPLKDANFTVRADFASASPISTSVLSTCTDIGNVFSSPERCKNIGRGGKQVNSSWESSSGMTVLEVVVASAIEPNLAKGTEIRFYYQAKGKYDGTPFVTDEFVKVFKIGYPVCVADIGDKCPPFLWSFSIRNSDTNATPEELDNFSSKDAKELTLFSNYDLFYNLISTEKETFNYSNIDLKMESKNPKALEINASRAAGAVAITSYPMTGSTERSDGSPIKIKPFVEAKFTELESKAEAIPAVADNNTVIFFKVTADSNLFVEGLPGALDPNVDDQEIFGTVMDLVDKNKLIGGAIVRILKNGEAIAAMASRTDENGYFYTVLQNGPALTDEIIVEIEKPNYRLFRQKIPVVERNPDPNYSCVTVNETKVNEATMALNKGESGTFKVNTDGCSERVNIMVSSELKTEPAETKIIQMNKTDTLEIKVTAKNKSDAKTTWTGEYPVYVKAKFASDVRFENSSLVVVRVSDPNSCFELSSTKANFETGQTAITLMNRCHTWVKDIWRPKPEMESFKAKVSYAPLDTLPNTVSFKWNIKLTGRERYKGSGIATGLLDQLVNVDMNIGDTADEAITTPVGFTITSGAAKLTSWLLNDCEGPSKHVAYVKDDHVTINVGASGEGTPVRVNIPCNETGCQWTSTACLQSREQCFLFTDRCQVNTLEFDLPQEALNQNVVSIETHIKRDNPDTYLIYYFRGRGAVPTMDVREHFVTVRNEQKNAEIPVQEAKSYYIGPVELDQNSLKKCGGFDLNVDMNTGIDANIAGTPAGRILPGNFGVMQGTMGQVLGRMFGTIPAQEEGTTCEGTYMHGYFIDANYVVETDNTKVETWIQDKNMVWARYIGDDKDNAGIIDLSIKDISLGHSAEFTFLSLRDYTNVVR